MCLAACRRWLRAFRRRDGTNAAEVALAVTSVETPPPTCVNKTVRAARAEYFLNNDLSLDEYQNRWFKIRLGRISLYLPNTKARREAVMLHDLHHVATGYATTWRGEAEIGAWELAGGCGRHWPAWGFKLAATALGVLIAPRRTVRAFRRGRRCRNLFSGRFDPALLDLTVGQLRVRLGLMPTNSG